MMMMMMVAELKVLLKAAKLLKVLRCGHATVQASAGSCTACGVLAGDGSQAGADAQSSQAREGAANLTCVAS